MNVDRPTEEQLPPTEWSNATMAAWCALEALAWFAVRDARKAAIMEDVARRLKLLKEKSSYGRLIRSKA